MPYNIWCDGCKKHIGMGVRYNAEKTKIGMYYTTPSLPVSVQVSSLPQQDHNKNGSGEHGLCHNGRSKTGGAEMGSFSKWSNCPG